MTRMIAAVYVFEVELELKEQKCRNPRYLNAMKLWYMFWMVYLQDFSERKMH